MTDYCDQDSRSADFTVSRRPFPACLTPNDYIQPIRRDTKTTQLDDKSSSVASAKPPMAL